MSHTSGRTPPTTPYAGHPGQPFCLPSTPPGSKVGRLDLLKDGKSEAPTWQGNPPKRPSGWRFFSSMSTMLKLQTLSKKGAFPTAPSSALFSIKVWQNSLDSTSMRKYFVYIDASCKNWWMGRLLTTRMLRITRMLLGEQTSVGKPCANRVWIQELKLSEWNMKMNLTHEH